MPEANVEARVSSLETSVANLTTDVGRVLMAVDSLRTTISEAQRPQWANWLSAVGLAVVIIGAIGSAFIAPLTLNLAHHTKLLDERGIIIDGLQDRLRNVESDTKSNLKTNEAQFESLTDRFEDVRLNGSPITRERLAVLEAAVAELCKEPPK